MHGRALFASFFLPSRHIRKNLFSFSFSTFWGLLLSDWIYFALLLVFQFYISLNSHIFPRAFYTFIPLARNHDNRIEFFPFLLREARNLFLSVLNSFLCFLKSGPDHFTKSDLSTRMPRQNWTDSERGKDFSASRCFLLCRETSKRSLRWRCVNVQQHSPIGHYHACLWFSTRQTAWEKHRWEWSEALVAVRNRFCSSWVRFFFPFSPLFRSASPHRSSPLFFQTLMRWSRNSDFTVLVNDTQQNSRREKGFCLVKAARTN